MDLPKPVIRVAVAGNSMAPTLNDGDWLLVGPNRRPQVGRLVLARRPDQPDLLLIKRAVERRAGGWWLEGDNPAASDDSRTFGVVPDELLRGVVLARYWPSPSLL